METYTEDDVAAILRSEVEAAGGQNAWAKLHAEPGKHAKLQSEVSRVLRGAIPPTKAVLEAMNLRREPRLYTKNERKD